MAEERKTQTVNRVLISRASAAIAAGMTVIAPGFAAQAPFGAEPSHVAAGAGIVMAASEGGQAGEGGKGSEDSEAGISSAGEVSNEDLLAQIGLIEGHLVASMMLVQDGHREMALTHVKHPGDEIYGALEPEFESRKMEGFARELEALAAAVEQSKPVNPPLNDLASRLEQVRSEIGATDAEKLKAVVKLVQQAAKEYAASVTGGKLTDRHEYQDAWGFMKVARGYASILSKHEEEDVAKAAAEIVAEIDKLDPVFPSVNPPGEGMADASIVYGAAARIEIAALKVK